MNKGNQILAISNNKIYDISFSNYRKDFCLEVFKKNEICKYDIAFRIDFTDFKKIAEFFHYTNIENYEPYREQLEYISLPKEDAQFIAKNDVRKKLHNYLDNPKSCTFDLYKFIIETDDYLDLDLLYNYITRYRDDYSLLFSILFDYEQAIYNSVSFDNRINALTKETLGWVDFLLFALDDYYSQYNQEKEINIIIQRIKELKEKYNCIKKNKTFKPLITLNNYYIIYYSNTTSFHDDLDLGVIFIYDNINNEFNIQFVNGFDFRVPEFININMENIEWVLSQIKLKKIKQNKKITLQKIIIEGENHERN